MRSPYRPLLFWAVVPLSGETRLLDRSQTPRGESVCPGEPLVRMGRFSLQLPEAVRCAGRGSCSDCHICAGDRPCRRGSSQAPLDRGPSRAPAHHGRRGRGPAQPPRPRRLLLLGAPHGPREDRGLGRDGHQGDSRETGLLASVVASGVNAGLADQEFVDFATSIELDAKTLLKSDVVLIGSIAINMVAGMMENVKAMPATAAAPAAAACPRPGTPPTPWPRPCSTEPRLLRALAFVRRTVPRSRPSPQR